jgi:CheY-like chemotaxis protein
MLGLQAPERPGKPEKDGEVPPSPRKEKDRRTVLVIDDEIALLTLISDVLEESGFTVLAVPDGPAGLAILQSGQPVDLLLTDIRLPKGMNGRQVAEAARNNRPALKILLMTGYAGSVLDDWPLAAGMELLTKPFDLIRLADRVRHLIED